MMDITYRIATVPDLAKICAFTDFWLRGYGKRYRIKGAGNDYFVPKRQHLDYLNRQSVLIALCAGYVVGWAVVAKNDTLIHLLVNPTFRGMRIGSDLVRITHPIRIRSKVDQESGNPFEFYRKCGYHDAGEPLQGKKRNIQVLHKNADS